MVNIAITKVDFGNPLLKHLSIAFLLREVSMENKRSFRGLKCPCPVIFTANIYPCFVGADNRTLGYLFPDNFVQTLLYPLKRPTILTKLPLLTGKPSTSEYISDIRSKGRY
jgi:hypothetical protein